MQSFYSNGKLLLTGEYVVLDGAEALALPTQFGQKLSIKKLNELKLVWESYSHINELWLHVEFDLPRLRIISETFDSIVEGSNDSLALNLQKVLLEAKNMNPELLKNTSGVYIKSKLDFPKNWGLGSSSTLINNIAQWAKIDAFQLQFSTFGGSAYDIACAQNNTSIIYQLKEKKPIIKTVNFNPLFKDQLYFIYLNKKQNSREGIAQYNSFKGKISAFAEEISHLTEKIIVSSNLSNFEKIIIEHEKIIASIIKQKPVQQELFSDYFGQTKSLGAWGGDFILATGNDDTPNYFKRKGFNTIFTYKQMILNHT